MTTRVKSGRTATGLAWFVGGTFIVLGIAEVAVRLLSNEPIETGAVAFRFFSLCGGGMLVLIGSFMLTRPTWAVMLVTLVWPGRSRRCGRSSFLFSRSRWSS